MHLYWVCVEINIWVYILLRNFPLFQSEQVLCFPNHHHIQLSKNSVASKSLCQSALLTKICRVAYFYIFLFLLRISREIANNHPHFVKDRKPSVSVTLAAGVKTV